MNRLEFLGDSYVGLIISKYLYDIGKFLLAMKGYLNKMRSRIVSREHAERIKGKI